MRFLFGLLFGFAAGLAAGLLYAPYTGEQTRARLAAQASSEWEVAQSQVQKGVVALQEQLSQVQIQLQELTKKQEEMEDTLEELEAD
jgi:gas vesicle protein